LESLDKGQKVVQVGPLKVGIFPKPRHFTLVYKSREKPLEEWWTSAELGSFRSDFSYQDRYFLAQNWFKIHEALCELDRLKGRLLDQIDAIRAEIAEENKPFKVLNKLTS